MICLITLSLIRVNAQMQNIDSLVLVTKSQKSDTNKVFNLCKVIRQYSNIGEYANALSYGKEANELAIKLKYKKGIALSDYYIGIIYNMQADYNKAFEFYNKSLKVSQEIGDKNAIVSCYTGIGIINEEQANYTKALEYHLKALKISEELVDKRKIANSYNNIAVVYETLSNFDKALEYNYKALKIRLEIGDKDGIGASYGNIGIVYQEQKKYKEALAYQFKSLAVRKELDDVNSIGNCYGNIAINYDFQAEYEKAIEYYLKALQVFEEIGNEQDVALNYVNLAGLYNSIGNYKSAILYSDSALQLSRKISNIDHERLSYENFAKAFAETGRYKEAYENHVKFKKLTDSIFNVENSKQLGDLKTQFEVEKRETELKAKAEAQEAINLEEKKRQTLIIYAVVFVLSIVVIFSALLYKRFRLTNKQKQIIELKEKETQQQNVVITQQKHLVEEKHKEITDSINYAERIQRSFLATKDLLDENLKDYFVLFKPKDVVSGDFYWASILNNGNFALVTADSTGHGVPGAIMSLLNITSLEKAIEFHFEPSDILNSTRKTIIERLKKDGSAEGGKDGMDASLIVFDFKQNQLHIAAANNPVWIVRENNLIEVKPDKMPVGKHDKDSTPFTQQTIDIQKGDVIYAITDGYPDQFGGEKGKKFMSKNLKELLQTNAHLRMDEQKELLNTTFKNWVGDLEQVDDVTVIGIRI